MKKMYLKKWMAGAMLLLAAGSYAQTVKLVLPKGQKYEITTTSKVNSVANVMGQDMENNVDNTTVQGIEVKDARTNETDLAITTTKMVSNVQAMGQEMSYDSDKKDNSGPMADAMGKMIGKTKNMTVDATGKILKQDKADKDTEMPMMMGGGSDGGVAIFQMAFIGKDLKTGASWVDSVVNNTDKMKTTTSGTYAVVSINAEKNTATISFTGTQTMSGVLEQMGQEMNMTGTSKVNTQYEVDINTGIILQSTVTNDGTMTIDAMGMSIPATTKSTTTTKVKLL
jgi:Family of unknown function (DUF6263)